MKAQVGVCKSCKYAPTTYTEYCMKSKCPNAYTDKAKECGNNKEQKHESTS